MPVPRPSNVMRSLVTGGRGFVGPHLIRHLEACGDVVVATDRNDGPDLGDSNGWFDLFDRIRPEVVYHLAAQSSVPASWADPIGTLEANVIGTANVVEAARSCGARRLLLVSSAEVYGLADAADLPLTELTTLRPATPYAASKAAAESVALQSWFGLGFEIVVVRAFNHTGPGQDVRFVVPAFADRIARNERTGVRELTVGDLSARRDFTDVRDVVRAYRLAMLLGAPGEVYNVCSGRPVEIAAVADLLLAQASVSMSLVTDPSLVRPIEVPALWGSAQRLSKATGWTPELSFEETAAELLDEARRRIALEPPPTR